MANKRPASEMSSSPTPGASSSGSGDNKGNNKDGKEKDEPPNKKIYIEQMNLGAVSSQVRLNKFNIGAAGAHSWSGAV